MAWIWRTQRDSKVCDFCRAREGDIVHTERELKQRTRTPGSRGYFDGIPAHYGCRCYWERTDREEKMSEFYFENKKDFKVYLCTLGELRNVWLPEEVKEIKRAGTCINIKADYNSGCYTDIQIRIFGKNLKCKDRDVDNWNFWAKVTMFIFSSEGKEISRKTWKLEIEWNSWSQKIRKKLNLERSDIPRGYVQFQVELFADRKCTQTVQNADTKKIPERFKKPSGYGFQILSITPKKSIFTIGEEIGIYVRIKNNMTESKEVLSDCRIEQREHQSAYRRRTWQWGLGHLENQLYHPGETKRVYHFGDSIGLPPGTYNVEIEVRKQINTFTEEGQTYYGVKRVEALFRLTGTERLPGALLTTEPQKGSKAGVLTRLKATSWPEFWTSLDIYWDYIRVGDMPLRNGKGETLFQIPPESDPGWHKISSNPAKFPYYEQKYYVFP